MSNWKETLAAIAPTVATAIGGPMAGMAVKMATSALGIEESPEALEKAIVSGDPEVMLKLKQAEQDFILKLKELDYKIEELHQKDRGSARRLAEFNMWPHIILSGVFVIGYFVILGMLVSGTVTIPTNMKEPVILLLGVITTSVVSIMQFWFGSSSGSKDKAKELDKLSTKVVGK